MQAKPTDKTDNPQTTDCYLIDKARVRQAFNKAAHTYDAAAIVQGLVRHEMLSRLDLVKLTPEIILDVGCGTGLGSIALQEKFPKAQVVSLDFAEHMLLKTKEAIQKNSLKKRIKRLFFGNKTHLICGDIEALPIQNNSVDFIWSNLALQWCNDIDASFSHFHRVLKPEGLLMFTTFGPDTLKELRAASAAAYGMHSSDKTNASTSVSRFIDMHDIGDALVRAGFSAPVLDVERFTLTYDDIKSVMMDLKSIGANNATQGRAHGLMGRGFLAKFAESYEQFRVQGKLPATFEVVYGHAWKPTPKMTMPDGLAPVTFKPRNK